jgi:mono/diheme cytochrome c family protein
MVEPLPSWSVHAQPAVAEVQIGDVEADKLIRMERAGEAEQAQGAVAQALQIPPPTVATIATTRSAGRRGPCRLACCPQDSREQPQLRSCGLVNNQRALEIYEFRKAAASGPERGQEIFYYKCWFCHNEFVQGIPQLKGLYQNSKLLSGESVNDDTVKEKIRNGGAGMAAYKYTLSASDLNDLVSYLREKCCWNSDTPPLNPRYRMR